LFGELCCRFGYNMESVGGVLLKPSINVSVSFGQERMFPPVIHGSYDWKKLCGWSEKCEEIWKRMHKHLQEHVEEHNSCKVTEKQNKQLKAWVDAQRHACRKGSLGEDRKDKLDALGFDWKETNEARWKRMYKRLQEHVEEHNSCKVTEKQNKQLKAWVDTQRHAHRKGSLGEDRKDKLDALGFDWKETNEARWKRMCKRLQEHVEEHNSCKVTEKQNKQLNDWVKAQRWACRKGSLGEDHKAKLNDIGFEFS